MSGEIKNKNIYTDESIQVLEGLEAVRKRPGMYIGSTDSRGLHHLIWEILDNAVDEVQAGYADEITLTVKPNHVITISDNGRGIPTGINPTTGTSNLLVVFTVLHAGGKFDNVSYKTSGGLHGVGSTCVNALSKFMEVSVCRDGKEHLVSFENGGKIKQEPKEIGKVSEDKHGTTVTWQPDFSIFDKEDYNLELIKERLSTLAFLNKQKKFIFFDSVNNERHVYYFERGIEDWITQLNESKEVISGIVYVKSDGSVKDRRKSDQMNKIDIECAFQYRMEDEAEIKSFCNNISTSQGGSHLEAFKDGLLDCIRVRALENKIVKYADSIEKQDIANALSAIVSLRYSNPEYSGQTKGLLSNTEIKKFIRTEVESALHQFMEENQEDMKKILERVKQSMQTRLKIEMTKKADRKIAREGFLSYADKLADCTLKDSEVSELYIVEGDSAGGSAKSARDRDFQAILPVKGKLMNVWKVKNRAKFADNQEIKNLIASIGCGYEYGNAKFDFSKMRYNKIIIMTDADVDGSHIRTLILTFLYKFMFELIEKGYVYVAQPPLYRASTARGETRYFQDERSKDEFIKNKKGWEISRFKGLGEMSPDQLWDTTMDPKTRTLLRVTVEMAKEAQDATFEDLMGDDVEPRTRFIRDNYHRASMVDV
ncbi:DNA gyrase/topoisomerase IV subunit B [Candidatus Mycoplasma haematohominis]|uniref:DNA topoisomerase (ATP-hydrolyzing) n=1 Tax=Candidatus Mycoplasma haematohominis TaxID=1494318 RepID=A0A478FS88_9MOLU|nr:DNA gyrase subunit B [Candidatus Mycoplasma haemohominis]GCE63236.1 DNA gyrase subunit B [Candidatus Mycoplasma haemohominis]